MIKFLMLTVLPSILLVILTANCFAFLANGKVTIKVLGEDGNPIEGARVGIGFDDHRSKSKENSVIGNTNSSGILTGSETTTSGYLAFNITKDGYYKTIGDHQFTGKKIFGWEPWNPELTFVLRKIDNPTPMYAKRAKIKIPVADKDVGFDLVEYDWVLPYGNGKTTDFVINFKMDDKGENDFEYSFNISFTNEYDGILSNVESVKSGSLFKLSRFAPLDGYEKGITVSMVGLKRGSKLSWSNDKHYIFRIRTEKENGKLLRGVYGKIISGIKIFPARNIGDMASLTFNYYLNPDYTRNLEFDPKRNLFGDLPRLEHVGIK